MKRETQTYEFVEASTCVVWYYYDIVRRS